jgi:hypothetical protein
VAISPDLGERYLHTIYQRSWVAEHFGTILSSRKDSTPGASQHKAANAHPIQNRIRHK